MNNEKKHVIITGRVGIYRDFSINLLNNILNDYVDRDSLCEDVDIRNHFMWCYNRVCEEFKLEDIDFSDNKELIEYYYTYYYNQFYIIDDNESIPITKFQNFWSNIFDINIQKNKNIIKILIELYHIYDTTINKKKIIMAIA